MGGRKTARSRRRRHRGSLKSRKVSRMRVSKRSRVSSRGQKGGTKKNVQDFFRANGREDLIHLLEHVDEGNLNQIVKVGFDTQQHEGTPGHRKVDIMKDLKELWDSLQDSKKFNEFLSGFLELDISLSQPDPDKTIEEQIEGLTHEIEMKMELLQKIGAQSIGPDIARKILSSDYEKLEKLERERDAK